VNARALVLAVLAIAAAVAASGGLASTASARGGVTLTPIGTYATGVFFDEDAAVGAAEIPAYDWLTRRLFVVNAVEKRIDVLSLNDPTQPTKLFDIDVSALGTPNSVDTRLGLVAVAVEAPVRTAPGKVAFFRANGTPVSTVDAGALPDMLTFTPNGRYALVANEGEPADDVDPKGSVTIVDLIRGAARPRATTVDFTAFDGAALDPSVVIAAGKLPSDDLEPEYITVSDNSHTAWVTLQEANAVAEVDVKKAQVASVRGLGFKDHGAAGNALDASDRDNAINICTWTNLFGMYQPDAIGSFKAHGETYLLTANEGDSREADEARVSALTLDAVFPPSWRQNFNLGRLTVNRTLGAEDGVHKRLFVYGARSFSIWRAPGELVFDSGDQLERITAPFPGGPAPAPPLVQNAPVPPAPAATCPRTAAAAPAPPLTTPFNSNSEEGNSFDTRSDNKGPEPEGVAIGQHFGHTYAFVGLERTGGVAVYDVGKPTAPEFETYVNPRDFNQPLTVGGAPNPLAGDVGPEGLTFIPFWQSPTFRPLVVVSNEVSGTTTVYELRAFPF
jgi:2',3'-cyclic-nucleotide 2'-phosphodiesterase / 3'-nucleotidase / 5'-nucleotidase